MSAGFGWLKDREAEASRLRDIGGYDAQESQAVLARLQRRRQAHVLDDIAAERREQDRKWGPVDANAFLVGNGFYVLVQKVG